MMAAIFCCRVIDATLAEMASAEGEEKSSRPLGPEEERRLDEELRRFDG